MPMIRGLPLRATIILSGSFLSMMAMAYAPITFLSASGTASSREMLWESIMYWISCTTTSVSVSLVKW